MGESLFPNFVGIMKLSKIVEKLEQILPDADPVHLARMAMLLANEFKTDEVVENDFMLGEITEELKLRLSAATDQLTAVALDLKGLAGTDPRDFNRDQIWVLIRALKVQNQVLGMYNCSANFGV